MKRANSKGVSGNPGVVAARKGLARTIADRAVAEGDTLTQIPGLRLYRRSTPTACTSAAYEPSLVVFVQGKKRINVARRSIYAMGRIFC